MATLNPKSWNPYELRKHVEYTGFFFLTSRLQEGQQQKKTIDKSGRLTKQSGTLPLTLFGRVCIVLVPLFPHTGSLEHQYWARFGRPATSLSHFLSSLPMLLHNAEQNKPKDVDDGCTRPFDWNSTSWDRPTWHCLQQCSTPKNPIPS